MALKFDGDDIPGKHGPIVVGSPEFSARRVKFYQVRGEGEVVNLPAGRSLAVRVLLHDKYTGTTPKKLLDKLSEMDEWVGINGTLKETGTVERTFDFCTFEGYEPIPNPGQEEPGPLLDVAGSLETNGANGWFILLMLRFRQLRVE